ncbi:hypothetical protein AA14337_3037 [Acetobacter malorum DSM 14337]|uniref:Polymer-forming cytoskeletal protein n=1 Tax=Acetobacter malorum DSM 14337 TaxID=1307910 RepID=A0ABQ0PZ84_9PROT|nr:hypothetical protein [Acetobacter malorum]KXV05629.1 hypothetical protein AD930_10840 [Acetobacter malorum]GBQ85301.1 hypothetical protein AA14337_3037 [Acetobacter malorum DSM 14337]
MSQTDQKPKKPSVIIGQGSYTPDMVLKAPLAVKIEGVVTNSTIEASDINIHPGGAASGTLTASVVVVEGLLEKAVVKADQIFISDTAEVSDCEIEVPNAEGLKISAIAKLYGKVTFTMPPRKQSATKA